MKDEVVATDFGSIKFQLQYWELLCNLLNKMPDKWRKNTFVPLYKNKCDIQDCSNYRGIKLISHTMKLWERVIEYRLRQYAEIAEKQFGFMPGRSTTEPIHILR